MNANLTKRKYENIARLFQQTHHELSTVHVHLAGTGMRSRRTSGCATYIRATRLPELTLNGLLSCRGDRSRFLNYSCFCTISLNLTLSTTFVPRDLSQEIQNLIPRNRFHVYTFLLYCPEVCQRCCGHAMVYLAVPFVTMKTKSISEFVHETAGLYAS